MSAPVQLQLPGLSGTALLSCFGRLRMERFVINCALDCEDALLDGDVRMAEVVSGWAFACARAHFG